MTPPVTPEPLSEQELRPLEDEANKQLVRVKDENCECGTCTRNRLILRLIAQARAASPSPWQLARYASTDHRMLLLYTPTSQRGRIDYGFRHIDGRFMVSIDGRVNGSSWVPQSDFEIDNKDGVTHYIDVLTLPSPPAQDGGRP